MKIPKYSICLTTYYDPEENPGKLSSQTIVERITAVVVNLKTDEIVESIEIWNDGKTDFDQAMDHLFEKTKKYKVPVMYSGNPEPLEKCPCKKCNNYLEHFINRKDYIDMIRMRKRARMRRNEIR